MKPAMPWECSATVRTRSCCWATSIPSPASCPSTSRGEYSTAAAPVDAKGPLAAFTDGAANLGAVPGWQIVVIGAVNEEASSSGAHYAVTQYAPEFAVIGEPNRWERIALGYKGTAHAQVTFTRPQAHSASGGETACEAAFALWQAVLAYKAAFNQDQPRVFDQVLPNLRSMQSGQDEFQQWAELNFGVRLPPQPEPGAVVREAG